MKLVAWSILFTALWGQSCFAQSINSIATGSDTDTYFEVGDDLHRLVLPELVNRKSNGSVENIKALSQEKGVTFAIVQSDVYQSYLKLANEDPDPAIKDWAKQLLASLRVVAPLYSEEIYFVVRKDSPMNELQDIEDKRMSIGPEGSGSNLTAKNIYFKLFGRYPHLVQPFIEKGVLGDDDKTKSIRSALWRLAHPNVGPEDRQVDVVVLIGGQPLPLLEKLGQDFKLLRTNIKNDATEQLLKDYSVGFADRKNYPFLTEHVPVMMVQSYLVTAQFKDKQRNHLVQRFAQQWCEHFQELADTGHHKWKESVWSPQNPRLPSLLSGWTYSEQTKPILEQCHHSIANVSTPRFECSIEDRAIGLCQ